MAKHFEKDMEILSIIAEYPQGLYLSQIQKYAHISSLQNAYKYCKRLIKQGSLTKKDKLYYATGKHLTNSHVVAQKVKLQVIPTRAHKLGVAYPLRNHLAPDTPPDLLQFKGREAHPVALKNNKQAILKIGNITAKLTTRRLELYSKDIYTDNRTLSIELEDEVKKEFDKVAEEIEARSGITLKRLRKDVFDTSIIAQHYAEEEHPASQAGPDNHKILAYSPIDHQRRLGWDTSKGPRELEFYHRLSAGTDKDTLDSQFNGVLDGKIDLWDIPFLKEYYVKQSDMLTGYARQIELHLAVMKKIDRKLSQKKLFEE